MNKPISATNDSDVQSAIEIMLTENEQLIHVDSNNNVLGSVGKIAAHQGKGVLHRAISVFLIDDQGQTLLTKRSANKPLWPGFWDAACSTHQWFPDETAVEATLRRVPFELGITLDHSANVIEHFASEYHAVYSPAWSENEINSIVVGHHTGECQPNEREVADHEWVSPQEVAHRLKTTPQIFAPWFSIAWEGLIERKVDPFHYTKPAKQV